MVSGASVIGNEAAWMKEARSQKSDFKGPGWIATLGVPLGIPTSLRANLVLTSHQDPIHTGGSLCSQRADPATSMPGKMLACWQACSKSSPERFR